MKTKSNTIIIVIIAFLIGVLVTSALNRNSTTTPEEEMTEDIAAMEENSEATESAPAPTSSGETAAPSSSGATTPTYSYTGSCAPSISGYKDNKLNAIVINWTTCESDNFQFYKILKSSKNPNPSYPADPVVVSSSNKDLANHIDKTVTRATTYYYRACVVQRLNKVNCGNVVAISY